MWVSFLDLGCQIIQVSANFIFEQQTVLILHIYPSQLIVSLLKFRHKWAQYIGTWTICFKKVSLTSAEHSWKVVKPILLWTNKHLLWFTLSESSDMSSKIIDLLVTWLPLMALMASYPQMHAPRYNKVYVGSFQLMMYHMQLIWYISASSMSYT